MKKLAVLFLLLLFCRIAHADDWVTDPSENPERQYNPPGFDSDEDPPSPENHYAVPDDYYKEMNTNDDYQAPTTEKPQTQSDDIRPSDDSGIFIPESESPPSRYISF